MRVFVILGASVDVCMYYGEGGKAVEICVVWQTSGLRKLEMFRKGSEL